MAEAVNCETITDLHKKERKELQAKIQSMKHGVSKGDKKKKKEILNQISILEAELAIKHEKELKECFKMQSPLQENENSETHASYYSTNVYNTFENGGEVKRVSKAQKRKEKKLFKIKEREELILQQEIENLSGARHIEIEKINKILTSRGLTIHEVPSDGDCLYKAVEHQLSVLNLKVATVEQLRKETSNYMLKHKEDFIPFLIDPDSGDIMTNEKYNDYCTEIATKPAWGGQVEIQALSHICSTPIEIIQADGPSIITGENYSTEKIILSYHRHMYGLGEHYNSVVVKVDSDDDGF